jgi:Fur family ferric uptake transcriptional regulator
MATGVGIELHRTVRDRLDASDQRYTAGRRAVVDALAGAGGPITLPELIERAPTLAQSSAYRNLAVLEEVGIVRRLVHGADHARYELAEDLTEHHHHLICERCGTVLDVTLTAELERRLDAAFDELARGAGFEPAHHTIDIYGLCADCRGRASRS